ncbi:MAG TPA: hypothetical protein VL346_09705 [Acidobacteriaceae bacterium]|nr:hypothetical protein [Acidobacteriaceae bacterium]
MPRTLAAVLSALALFPVLLHAQKHNMPGMEVKEHPPAHQHEAQPMQMGAMSQPTTLIEAELRHASSGTSIEPASTPTPMLMSHRGSWMLMLHGTAFLTETQQHTATSQRGGDKLFSTNWIMPMAQRPLGSGQLTLRAMFSLEPATVTDRQYPLLFQQGETAFGKPIIDGQHPHNFFMEVGALYDIRLGERALLSFYAAPIGDPAIGPVAYPHRLSASEDPLAALGHHQEDSTHIAYNVLTAGITWRGLRFEQSGFHGGEPTEQRWQFQPSANGHAIDSYSSRLTFSPSANWSSQYSIAHIVSPEALYAGEDQQRQTASIMYNRPFGSVRPDGAHSGNWSSTLLWGRTRPLAHDNTHTATPQNSYLAESLLQFDSRNYLWTRIENAGRSTELLIPPGTSLPPDFEESPIGHVQAYTLGYSRDFQIAPHLLAAPGAQFTSYTAPQSLIPTYGHHPFGVVASIRFRLSQ